MVFDHHMDVRKVETPLQPAERRADSVGQHVVEPVEIRMAAPQSITRTAQTSAEVSEDAFSVLGRC